uniref:Annexin n=1 Tax=Electrophorus electricus TaxID=8005 RepID=A0AAY5ELR4_ELEEL
MANFKLLCCIYKDVHSLVRILTNRSNDQRQKLNTAYQNLTQKDLKAGLRKVLSGNLEFLMLSLMMPPEQFEAYRLRQAMEGLGTDEETLLEILCTRTAQQLSNITATYNKEFKRNLEKDLVSDTSGDFSRLLVALLKVSFVTRFHKQVLIYLEAEKGQSASEIIEKHFGGIFSGDFRLGLETLVRCIENSDLYLAQRIRTMKWPVVQGVMVSHSEEDLVAVRVAYKQEAGTSLYTALQKQFTGELQYALLAICRAED